MEKRPQLNIRTTDEFSAAIDEIRRMTAPIPSVTEAIFLAVLDYRDKLKKRQKVRG